MNLLYPNVTSSSFAPTSKDQSGAFRGATGIVPIIQGADGLNKWSFIVDTFKNHWFRPGEYIVRVSGVTVDVVGTATFPVIEGCLGYGCYGGRSYKIHFK